MAGARFFKARRSLLCQGVHVTYACIAPYVGPYPVTLMGRVLAVSRRGFYAAQTRQPSRRAPADALRKREIEVRFEQSRQR